MGTINYAYRCSSAALVIALSSLGFVSCGGGGTSSSSPTTAGGLGMGVRTITSRGRPAGEAPPSSPGTATTAHPGHGPAGFRVARGDNSVPDFGDEASARQRRSAVATLAAFMRARANGEWSKVCQHLARPVLQQLGSRDGRPGGCGTVLGALLHERSRSELANTLTHGVAALRIKGDTAFALFYGPSSAKYVMPMQLQAGEWKMTQLAPLPYPLGTVAPAP